MNNGLKFSTDPIAKKSKTKCIAYTKDNRKLRNLILCGNILPWVSDCKHLGNKINDNMDGLKKDMSEKRARYINKNNELCQEFSLVIQAHYLKLIPYTIVTSLVQTYGIYFLKKLT